MSEGFDLKELGQVARDKSPEGRSKMFALLARLFWRRGSIMKPKEKVMLAEILRVLRPKTVPQARMELAYEMAGSTLAEPELLKVFAEDEIEIASPVLFSNNRLEPEDLVAVVESRGISHGAVIAQRKGPTIAVVDALSRLEDPEILRRLLADAEAPFSISALSAAAITAMTDVDLQRLLADRRELPESIAEDMMEWADPQVRETLNARFLFDAMVASAAKPVYGQKATALPETKPSEESGEIELSPASMISALRSDNLALFQAQIAHLANLRLGLVRKLMSENGGDSIAFIARAIGLRRDEFAQIYLLVRKLRTKAGGIGAADLGQALDFFDRTEPAQASSIIARWRRESAREALTESEDIALPPMHADQPAPADQPPPVPATEGEDAADASPEATNPAEAEDESVPKAEPQIEEEAKAISATETAIEAAPADETEPVAEGEAATQDALPHMPEPEEESASDSEPESRLEKATGAPPVAPEPAPEPEPGADPH